MSLDWLRYNREAWDQQVEEGTEWTVPVSAGEVAFTRRGQLRICVTPTRFVPVAWWPATLEDQLAGQLDAGFLLAGFYEDRWAKKALDARIATFGATRAIKSRSGVVR